MEAVHTHTQSAVYWVPAVCLTPPTLLRLVLAFPTSPPGYRRCQTHPPAVAGLWALLWRGRGGGGHLMEGVAAPVAGGRRQVG